jgi:hypothetical protein
MRRKRFGLPPADTDAHGCAPDLRPGFGLRESRVRRF